MGYPEREWKQYRIVSGSQEEAELLGCCIRSGLICCDMDSETGNDIMRQHPKDFGEIAFFRDFEFLNAGVKETFGLMELHQLDYSWRDHHRDALVVKTSSCSPETGTFLWLVEI